MDFEEWWWPRKPLGDELISGDVVTTAARAAWEAGFYRGRVHESGNNMARHIDADLTKLFIEAGNVPKGYVLVPVEPTEKALLSILGGVENLSGEQFNYEPIEFEYARASYARWLEIAQEEE